jgi:hypothetical protein
MRRGKVGKVRTGSLGHALFRGPAPGDGGKARLLKETGEESRRAD